eukprot:CAMPEP_0184695376 /NCGR_PEP_ID=MMETSP0313-20130426/3023_1 /TAXON_ID=2792 /ORGANISM="Porphyridium aerugineum, Strain SAG 1380-2" /LENGTH=130 /DNA_ID=CAMNT_0027153813 /DNA_START=41 /DNA_END=433 /DNA_ORIENTATION=-
MAITKSAFVSSASSFLATKTSKSSTCSLKYRKSHTASQRISGSTTMSMVDSESVNTVVSFVQQHSQSEQMIKLMSEISTSDHVLAKYYNNLLAVDLGPIKDVSVETLALVAAILGGSVLALAIIIIISRT